MSGHMTGSVTRMIEDVIAREGGYVNHPADRGGPTKFGVTLKTLRAWRGEDVDAEDVRRLTTREATSIYQTLYFERPRIQLLPSEVQPFLFDCVVHHGPRAAVLLLQRVLNENDFACARDGVIGTETANACAAAHAAMGRALIDALIDARLAVLNRIAANDSSQRVFLRGWTRRVESFRVTAMAAGAQEFAHPQG